MIEIKIKDPEENFILLNVTVRVEDVNEIPIFSNLPATINVTEDIDILTVVYTFMAFDEDHNRLTFATISNGSSFQQGSNGTIIVFEDLDYERKTQHKLTCFVSDGLLNSSSYLIINVMDVNESPSFKSTLKNNISITENLIGSIYNVPVVDQDFNDPLTFNITTSPQTSLIYINQEGNIKTNGLDFELFQSYIINVVVSDKAGLNIKTNLTLDVLNVQEPPTIINLPKMIPCVLESVNDDTIIYTINSTDQEKDIVNYNLLSSIDKFMIDNQSKKKYFPN